MAFFAAGWRVILRHPHRPIIPARQWIDRDSGARDNLSGSARHTDYGVVRCVAAELRSCMVDAKKRRLDQRNAQRKAVTTVGGQFEPPACRFLMTAYGRSELHTAHRLQAEDRRIEVPVEDRLTKSGFETLALREAVLDRAPKLVERDLLPKAVKRA
jgi:hypothetical protein